MATIISAGSGSDTVPVLIQTNVGGFVFDAVFKADHNSSLKITEHPIQTGANVADHAILQPRQLILEIGVSDVMTPLNDMFSDGPTRSINAFKKLLDLQSLRVPFKVVTRLNTYENMLVQNISAPDDYTTMNALKATITLQEIIVVNVQTIKISSKPQVTSKTNKGTKQVQQPNESVLSKAKKSIYGGGN